MPCSEPRFPELEKHRDQAIPLLCAVLNRIAGADGVVTLTTEEKNWLEVHTILDELPGGWQGYEAGEIMERVHRIMKERRCTTESL